MWKHRRDRVVGPPARSWRCRIASRGRRSSRWSQRGDRAAAGAAQAVGCACTTGARGRRCWGGPRRVAKRSVDAYLRSGLHEFGVARFRCRDTSCRTELLVPFSVGRTQLGGVATCSAARCARRTELRRTRVCSTVRFVCRTFRASKWTCSAGRFARRTERASTPRSSAVRFVARTQRRSMSACSPVRFHPDARGALWERRPVLAPPAPRLRCLWRAPGRSSSAASAPRAEALATLPPPGRAGPTGRGRGEVVADGRAEPRG